MNLYLFRTFSSIHRLAYSLIMSRINYCLEVYSRTWNYNLNKIENIIRKIVRYVHNVGINEHEQVTELVPVFLKCSFIDYINMRIIIHFYKIMRFGKPLTLLNEIYFINSTRNVQIVVPISHSSVRDHSFVIRIHRTWSILPNSLKLFCLSYITYKKKLLNYFNEELF